MLRHMSVASFGLCLLDCKMMTTRVQDRAQDRDLIRDS